MVLDPLLAHLDAGEERALEQVAIALVERLEQISQDGERRLAIELVGDVPFAARYQHRPADGPAPLGDDGVDGEISRKSDADRTAPERFVAEEQPVLTGRSAAAREPADLGHPRIGGVERADELGSVEGERIGEEQQVRPFRANPEGLPQLLGRAGGQFLHAKGLQVDPGQGCGGQRQRRLALHLVAVADDAECRAAEDQAPGKLALDQLAEADVGGPVMGRDEGGDEIRARSRERLTDCGRRFHDGVLEARILGERGSPPHASLSATRFPEAQRDRPRGVRRTGARPGRPSGRTAARCACRFGDLPFRAEDLEMKSREVVFLSVGLILGAAFARLVFRRRGAPDSVIAERVRHRLRRLGAEVEVSVSGGEVELRGSVPASDHPRILRAVSRVRGVRAIDDDLALLQIAHGSFLH